MKIIRLVEGQKFFWLIKLTGQTGK